MLAYSSLTSLDLGSNVRKGKDREGGSEENYIIMMLVHWQAQFASKKGILASHLSSSLMTGSALGLSSSNRL
jgi:hypothetical protein